MSRELIHIYGPFSIQSFGLIIAIGLLLFIWLTSKHVKAKKIMSSEQFSETILVGVISGILGGRLLFVAEAYWSMDSFFDIFRFWEGGFSILGTIIAVPLALTLYLKRKKIPVLPFFDLIALYGPLLQSISRIGCFAAGCCYGACTTLPWSVIYTDPCCMAPLHTPLHPTQLYSSVTLFVIFIFMRFIASKIFTIPGQLITLYITLAALERFFVDFLRADRDFFTPQLLHIFSIHQWLALNLAITTCSIFISITIRSRSKKHESL